MQGMVDERLRVGGGLVVHQSAAGADALYGGGEDLNSPQVSGGSEDTDLEPGSYIFRQRLDHHRPGVALTCTLETTFPSPTPHSDL